MTQKRKTIIKIQERLNYWAIVWSYFDETDEVGQPSKWKLIPGMLFSDKNLAEVTFASLSDQLALNSNAVSEWING